MGQTNRMSSVAPNFQKAGISNAFDVDINRVGDALYRRIAFKVANKPVHPSNPEADTVCVENEFAL